MSCHSIGLNEYEIGCLCIIPEYQGNGIGTREIKFVQNYYEDWMRMTLITPLDKQENIRFNTDKCGFQIVDTERDGNVELILYNHEVLPMKHLQDICAELLKDSQGKSGCKYNKK